MSEENLGIAQGLRIPVPLGRPRRRRTLDEQLLGPVSGARLDARVCLADSLLAPFDPEFEYRVLAAGGLIAPDQVGTHRGHEGYRKVWQLWLEASEDVRLEPEVLIDLGDRLVSLTRVWDFYVEAVEAWDQGSFEWGEILDAGDDRIVANQLRTMRGKASGASVASSYWVMFTFRNGKVLRSEWFADQSEAFEAAGLQE